MYWVTCQAVKVSLYNIYTINISMNIINGILTIILKLHRITEVENIIYPNIKNATQ